MHFRPEVTVPKVTTSMPAPPPRPSNSTQLPLSQSLSQHIDQVLVSDEDLAFFEELERQALAQYPTNHGQAVPPVPVHSTIVNKPSNSTSSSSVYSSVNRSDSNNNLPLVVKRNFCIRLIVKEVLDGPAGSKVIRAIDFKAAQSTGTASSSSTIPTPACSNTSRTYVVHLCDDW